MSHDDISPEHDDGIVQLVLPNHPFDKPPRYHLVMTNIAMENPHAIKFGKPSISMGHLFPMAMLVITRGYPFVDLFLAATI